MFVALTRIQHDGVTHEPGAALPDGVLSEAQAAHLLACGSIEAPMIVPEPDDAPPAKKPRGKA